MNEQQRPSPQQQAIQKRNDAKTLLSALRWTTTVGAVSLTLAGWGILSRADALNAVPADQSAVTELADSAAVALATNGSGSLASTAATQLVVNTGSSTGSATEESTGGSTESDTGAAAAIAWPTATATAAPTATAAATATAAPTATLAPTATPTKVITLDVTQWVQDSEGNSWAVVQDNSGVLWYVWGSDVERIEQGLDPQVQPQPVNTTASSRGS